MTNINNQETTESKEDEMLAKKSEKVMPVK
jgi:hypothetical protein